MLTSLNNQVKAQIITFLQKFLVEKLDKRKWQAKGIWRPADG